MASFPEMLGELVKALGVTSDDHTPDVGTLPIDLAKINLGYMPEDKKLAVKVGSYLSQFDFYTSTECLTSPPGDQKLTRIEAGRTALSMAIFMNGFDKAFPDLAIDWQKGKVVKKEEESGWAEDTGDVRDTGDMWDTASDTGENILTPEAVQAFMAKVHNQSIASSILGSLPMEMNGEEISEEDRAIIEQWANEYMEKNQQAFETLQEEAPDLIDGESLKEMNDFFDENPEASIGFMMGKWDDSINSAWADVDPETQQMIEEAAGFDSSDPENSKSTLAILKLEYLWPEIGNEVMANNN